MALFPKVNMQRVADQVSDFFLCDDFEHPRNYSRIVRRANVIMGLTGDSGDVTGIRGSAPGNVAENRLIENDKYYRAEIVVKQAINACSTRSRIILTERYVNHSKVWMIQRLINLTGNDSYQKADRLARLEFADAIDAVKDKFLVSDDLIPSFLKEEENRMKTGREQDEK